MRADFTDSDQAVESALSRLVANDELLRVRRGLYWNGQSTRFGMTRPTKRQVALRAAGHWVRAHRGRCSAHAQSDDTGA